MIVYRNDNIGVFLQTLLKLSTMENNDITNLVKLFHSHANPENAMWMKKYMRNKFEYLGIKTPLRKNISKEFIKKCKNSDNKETTYIIKYFWELPQREFQYFAIDILTSQLKNINKETLNLYEYIILTKSWWDTVDNIACRLAGNYFKKFPEMIPTTNKKWINSDNIWLKRSALLFQLNYKKDTDTCLLFSNINKCSDSKEFFIQKAIGWVLREYSKTDALIVKNFVNNNNLAPLSKREALRLMIVN
ncbi:MAG: DNA alkylation repair protein [Bacteroidales bacterium]|nr:DNA alkylation repair protein [Bacteroidales bacterium]